MRVLHVSPYFPPTWAYGGIPRIVHGLARELVRRGVETWVWTTDALDTRRAPADRDVDGIRVIATKNLSNRLAYRHQLFLPLAPVDLPEVDLVHLHGHRHLLNQRAFAWAKAKGLPVVMTPNGTLPRIERKQGIKLLVDTVASAVPRGADRLVAVSAAEARHFVQHGIDAERVVRIPNGLFLDEFASLPERGTFRRKWGIEGRIVAYLGQISPRKGVDHLAAAFAGGAIADATLVVGGNDMGGLARARENADESVVFTGLLEGDDRLALLVDADVLVYPSTQEVFGLVPFEGLMCGTPVVVGGDCGCGELISAAGAGLLVQHADVEGLRARIRTLLDDRRAATAMVERGRRYVAENLSFERVGQLHLDLYRSLGAR